MVDTKLCFPRGSLRDVGKLEPVSIDILSVFYSCWLHRSWILSWLESPAYIVHPHSLSYSLCLHYLWLGQVMLLSYWRLTEVGVTELVHGCIVGSGCSLYQRVRKWNPFFFTSNFSSLSFLISSHIFLLVVQSLHLQ